MSNNLEIKDQDHQIFCDGFSVPSEVFSFFFFFFFCGF